MEIYSINLAYDVRRVFGKPATSIDPSDLEGKKSGVDPLFSPVPLYAGMARPDYMWATGPATEDVEINGLVPPEPPRRLLLVYRHGPYTHSNTQNNLLLNTLTPSELLTAWMHPDTAAALGVKDGDWIEVKPAAPKVAKQLESVKLGTPGAIGNTVVEVSKVGGL